MPRVIWFATLGALLGSARAGAQLCTGAPSFRRPVQVSVGTLFNTDAKSLVVGLAVGSRGVFGEGQLGTSYYDALDGSSFNFGAGVGYQLTLDQQARAQVCPMLAVAFVSGPRNIRQSGNDYSERDVELGLAAGVVALRSKQVQLVPTASIAYAHASGKLTNGLGVGTTYPASFGVVGLGVGVEFSRQVSLIPVAAIPFSVRGAHTSYGITVAVNLSSAH
ncbi:MAG TPA: hypothetical protein VN953_07930 [Gemmatimonadales bacterium]|nr:hypothetical protein [Gemmatimonadales bacterium]